MILSFFNNHVGAIQAITAIITAFASLVLIGVTTFYAWQTRNTVEEMKRNSAKEEAFGVFTIYNKCLEILTSLKYKTIDLHNLQNIEKINNALLELINGKYGYLLKDKIVWSMLNLLELLKVYDKHHSESDYIVEIKNNIDEIYNYLNDIVEKSKSICIKISLIK